MQNCCFVPDGLMLLEISLMVRVENMQHEFVDLRQYILENLFVVYVAMNKTQDSGRSEDLNVGFAICLGSLLC